MIWKTPPRSIGVIAAAVCVMTLTACAPPAPTQSEEASREASSIRWVNLCVVNESDNVENVFFGDGNVSQEYELTHNGETTVGWASARLEPHDFACGKSNKPQEKFSVFLQMDLNRTTGGAALSFLNQSLTTPIVYTNLTEDISGGGWKAHTYVDLEENTVYDCAYQGRLFTIYRQNDSKNYKEILVTLLGNNATYVTPIPEDTMCRNELLNRGEPGIL